MKVNHWKGMVLICMLIPSPLAFGQRARLPEGTAVRVRLKADLASEQVQEAARVEFEVVSPVVVQGMTVIPEGAVAWGAVQSVKAGKYVKFDIEGVQLPDGTNIKLRCLGARAKNPAQDQIKVESSFKGGVGAPKGSEYTAYVDEGREVALSGQPTSVMAPAATSPAAPTAPATPAPTPPLASEPVAAPTPSTVPPTVTPATPAPVTAPGAPSTPSLISAGQAAAPSAKVERVTVECYSDPSGADILIDGEFYGNTPSILKLPVGRHELELQLSGYKTYAIPLILHSDMPLRTVHPNLEQKE